MLMHTFAKQQRAWAIPMMVGLLLFWCLTLCMSMAQAGQTSHEHNCHSVAGASGSGMMENGNEGSSHNGPLAGADHCGDFDNLLSQTAGANIPLSPILLSNWLVPLLETQEQAPVKGLSLAAVDPPSPPILLLNVVFLI
jgi:hypothetical protein